MNENDETGIFIDEEHFRDLLPFLNAYAFVRDQVMKRDPPCLGPIDECKKHHGVEWCDDCPEYRFYKEKDEELTHVLENCLRRRYGKNLVVKDENDGDVKKILKKLQETGDRTNG